MKFCSLSDIGFVIQLNVHFLLIINMEVKKRVVNGTVKVNTCIENFNFSVSKKNTRLVQKYTSQLEELLDTLLDMSHWQGCCIYTPTC